MRRSRLLALTAVTCAALAACSPPHQVPSDATDAYSPTRGPVPRLVEGTGEHVGEHGTGSGEQRSTSRVVTPTAPEPAAPELTESAGLYNLIEGQLVQGTVELRTDGAGHTAAAPTTFPTLLPEGGYGLRAYENSACSTVTPGGATELGAIGELVVTGGMATIEPQVAAVEASEVLTVAAVARAGQPDAEVVACGRWIRWHQDALAG